MFEKQKICYIPHYVKIEGREISFSQEVRKKWVENYSNSDCKNKEIFCVYGELSSVNTIKEALKYNIAVHVIIGNHIAVANRDEICQLKKDNSNLLHIYSYKYGTETLERPKYHSARIGNNLFFEEYHDLGSKYDTAKIILSANKNAIRKYTEIFQEYLRYSRELTTPEEISGMPVYAGGCVCNSCL